MALINENLLEFKYKKLSPEGMAPQKNPGDVGWDLKCIEDENFKVLYNGPFGNREPEKCVELEPGERYGFKTGIAIQLPEGYHAVIKPRSGLAIKHGVEILAGIIDNSYSGEIIICLKNGGNSPIRISPKDKIAQMLIFKENEGYFTEVYELRSTDRGDKGFGSTGK